MTNNKTVIIIAGPTAVGKTSVAIEVARYFGTEIISADSRQCYREMNIGVARPTPEELASVPHHFIATHSINEKITAVDFEKYALEKAQEIFASKDVVVMVGGTGLYIKAFCEGLDEIPEVSDQIRQQTIADYEKQGLNWLQEQVQLADPEFFKAGEMQNPHRLLRVLEVFRATGHPISFFRKGVKKAREFNVIKIGLELPKEELHERIYKRVDQMMGAGLLEEVRSLLPYKQHNALQTVGYKELFSYLENEITMEQAIEEIKKNTRQYAKRQMTWFKKDSAYQWFTPKVDLLIQMLTNKV